jgi:hypothetical protein
MARDPADQQPSDGLLDELPILADPLTDAQPA